MGNSPTRLVEAGYPYLASTAGEAAARQPRGAARHGADVACSRPRLQQREWLSWLSTDGVSLGSLGLSAEGWSDGCLLQACGARPGPGGARCAGRGGGRGRRPAAAQHPYLRAAPGGWPAAEVALGQCRWRLGAPPRWRSGIDLPVFANGARCKTHFTCPEALPGCRCSLTPRASGRPGTSFTSRAMPHQLATPTMHRGPGPRRFPRDHVWPTWPSASWPSRALRLAQHLAGFYEMNAF